MTREDHLCYCHVCTKRKLQQIDGLVCGLTGKIADFRDTCDKFDLDKNQKKENNEQLKTEITKNIEAQKSILKQILGNGPQKSFLIEKKQGSTDKELGELVVSESKSRKSIFLLGPILLLGGIGYSIYKNGINLEGPLQYILFTILFAGIPGVLVYHYFKNSEIFRMSNRGLIIEQKKFIPWFNVQFVYFEVTPSETKTINLILKTESGSELKLDVTYANLKQEKLGECVYEYIKKYKVN